MDTLQDAYAQLEVARLNKDWDTVNELNRKILDLIKEANAQEKYTEEDQDLNRWNTMEYRQKNNLD